LVRYGHSYCRSSGQTPGDAMHHPQCRLTAMLTAASA
jgi:hypothetical protein